MHIHSLRKVCTLTHPLFLHLHKFLYIAITHKGTRRHTQTNAHTCRHVPKYVHIGHVFLSIPLSMSESMCNYYSVNIKTLESLPCLLLRPQMNAGMSQKSASSVLPFLCSDECRIIPRWSGLKVKEQFSFSLLGCLHMISGWVVASGSMLRVQASASMSSHISCILL